MKIEVDVVVPDLDLQGWINRTLEDEVYPYFRQWATDIVEDKIDEREGEQYTVSVDSRISTIEGIVNAKKEVMVVWIQSAIAIAINEFDQILMRTAKTRAAVWRNKKSGRDLRKEIPPSVKVFYGGENKPLKDVTSLAHITNFEFGDYILVTASSPWQQYLNTKGKAEKSQRVHPPKKDIKGHRGGYFGFAAKRIRRKLGANRRNSTALWVGAIRSRAVLEAIGMPPLRTPEGQANWVRLQNWGAWAIKISWSRRLKPGQIRYG